jgi:hypothetical protein
LIFNPHADIASIHSLQGIAMLLGGVLILYFLDGMFERFTASEGGTGGSGPRASRGARTPIGARVGAITAFSAVLFGASWLGAFDAPRLVVRKPAEMLD